ncbi:hypothetical protein A3L11_10435 [Thermococcus siculi]|uniref:Uncharacterized protein n=2 Tax=Thermococcus siculi TaxID=72803 RepID=A0A2Z2MV04_9EURY|nr:hypothetical protein A3L11_10435 [Thermococcus siculi]
MLLAHRKRKGYIIEKGLFGREKKIEQEYLYEKHLGLTPLADNVLGKALGVGTTHTLSERFVTQTL